MARLTSKIELPQDTPDALKREVQNLRAEVTNLYKILNNPFFNGKILRGQSVTTTETTYYHGLERNYTGFFIINKDASCDVRLGATDHDKRTVIRLVSSASATVDILVF